MPASTCDGSIAPAAHADAAHAIAEVKALLYGGRLPAAIERAIDASIGWDTLTDDPETSLWVMRVDGVDHLAWKVQLRRIDGFLTKAGTTQDMGRQLTVGIKPHFARTKKEARVTDLMDPLHLFG